MQNLPHSKYLLLLLLLPALTWSWCAEGHRVVAHIAEEQLTPQTKKRVAAILKPHSMVEVSTWADQIRPKDHRFDTWHYTTLPTPKSTPDEHSRTGKLLTGIEKAKTVLQDPKASEEDKALYLKLLIHLVADAHQPLHVGNGMDRGGNQCWVQWHKRKASYSLHSIWDSFLVKHTLQTSDLLTNSQAISANKKKKWAQSPVSTWLQESRALHESIYPPLRDPRTPYCQDKNHRWIPKHHQPKLGKDYAKAMHPIVEQRLLQAGVRLAHQLNVLFDPKLKISNRKATNQNTA